MADILEKLNPQQREAASSMEKRILIIAGAGTGKTQTLMSRVAYLVSEGTSPESILLLTFTNKAADEMKERAVKLAGESCAEITASTYHSFCCNQLRKFGKSIGLPDGFKVLSENDAEDIMRFIRSSDDRYKIRQLTASTVLSLISSSVNTETPLEEVADREGFPEDIEGIIMELSDKYRVYKEEHNMLDFDDLLIKFLELLDVDRVREQLSQSYRHILVDEFQDTNNIQMKIVDRLLTEETSLVVVGDDYQCIYAFRGANLDNFLGFEERYAPVKKIVITENYRSTDEILNAANTIMSEARKRYYADGYEKNMKSGRNGQRPYIVRPKTQNAETSAVLREIMTLRRNGAKNGDIAVLYRANRTAYGLEVALNRSRIPYSKYGGQGFFDIGAVRDLLAFQKVLINHNDETQWFRILDIIPNIGEKVGHRARHARSPDNSFLCSWECRSGLRTVRRACRYPCRKRWWPQLPPLPP